MSVIEAAAPGRTGSPFGTGGRAAVRESLDAAAHLLGLTEERTDRSPVPLTIRLGHPGGTALTLIDHREASPRSHRLDAGADDFIERLGAIRGGQAGLKAKILVDPARCFIRSLVVPSAALPRMRAVLAQELEATTPFRPESVHSDWYVEAEDVPARTLRVRHVVLKRARLDPLLDALAQAGIPAGPVTVGPDEARTMPVDLLTGGHRALPGLARGARAGNLALTAAATLLLLGAFWGFRQHQAATLTALDAAFVQARQAAGPAMPAPIRAGAAAILAGRAPPLAETWDALAAALPDTASVLDLRLDAQGAHLTLSVADEGAALAALRGLAGFGAPILRDAPAAIPADPGGRRRRLVTLPRTGSGARP